MNVNVLNFTKLIIAQPLNYFNFDFLIKSPTIELNLINKNNL